MGSGQLNTESGQLNTESGQLNTGSGQLQTGSGKLQTGSETIELNSINWYTVQIPVQQRHLLRDGHGVRAGPATDAQSGCFRGGDNIVYRLNISSKIVLVSKVCTSRKSQLMDKTGNEK